MADSEKGRGEESLYVNVESVSQVDKRNDSVDGGQTMSTNNKPVPTLAELMSLLEGPQSECSSSEGGEEAELSTDQERSVRGGIRSLQVVLKGGGPWGFTLCGGDDQRSPLRVAEIDPGGRADTEGSLLAGDCISRVNDVGCSSITEAVQLIQSAFRTLTLQVLRGHVNQSGSTPLYLRRAREAEEEQDSAVVPQDDSIMYRESKHTLQSGAMKMKARQKPSRGESFCVGSSGVEKSVLGSSRASLSPRHATRNYENLQSKSPIDGNRSRQRGLPFSQPAYKHLSQEDLVDRSRRESSDVLPNSIGDKSGPLSPAKSTPALNRVTMEDAVSSRYHSHSKPGFYSAKSSPNINQELDVSVLGEPPKLVRPSVYADKQLNRSGVRFPQKSVWERDKGYTRSVQHRSPLEKESRHTPSSAQTPHHTKDSHHATYHSDTSFQPIIDKDADNRQSVPYRRNYRGHDYKNLDYSAPYKHSGGYEPSDSGSDSELEDPPAIPPPPHPATLLNPGLYPPCSPPAPPIRDLATIKVCSVNQSHEKYPSWPVTTPNARGTAQQSQPITSRAESWNDHTNTSSEFPRKQRMACLPFQPNLRPLTEKNGSDGKSRNSSDPGLKNVMYHAAVAKIDDVSEDGIKNFYNSMYPPPKYDSDGHNLGDKEYSVPSPPERDIPITSNKLPPSNLASPTPNQYNVQYQSSEHSQSSPRNNLPRQPAKSQGTSPLQSPRDETQPRSITSQSSVSAKTRRQSVDRSAEGGGSGHHPPKHVDSRGYIVTPRPYYNTGTQTEVNSHEAPPQSNNDIKKDNKVDQRPAEVQVNDMASQTSPKRPDSLNEQWPSGERKPTETLSVWQNSESINGLDKLKEVESPARRKSESWNRSAISGNLDVRVTRGRRSEVIPPSFHKDQRYKNVQEKKSQNESLHRDSSWAQPVNTHRTEESRDSNIKDKEKHDGAINYPLDPRNSSHHFDYKQDKHLSNMDRVRDLESGDDFKPSIRSKYSRRSEPPLPYSGSRITGDVLEDDTVLKGDGSQSSVPSYHDYTPSTAPLLRMLSKEMYGQQFSTRPPYQHDKSLSFSSQENSSRSIGSPTPSSQYGMMKEAESYSSVLIYSDASSGPFGRDDFGSQQSLGSQISLLPESKSSDYNKDLYLDKNVPSDDLSPRELIRAMRNKYSFDNTFQAFKQANNPIHKYSASDSSALNYSHNYVNTFDLDSSDRNSSNLAMSPKSVKSIHTPSSTDKRSTMPQTTKRSGSPSGQTDSRQVIHHKQKSSGSSMDLSNQSSPGTKLNSKSSEDLRIRTPSNKDERQPPSRSQSSRNLPYKKHSSSGSSSDQSVASPLSRSEQLQTMEPQQKISSTVSSETAKIAPIRQLSREELGDSVFAEESTVSNSDKPPQGRKRGTEKIVTRQESMKRAMGTFDEGEQTLYTTTYLSKTSKSWTNLQDAQKTNSSKAPPRSQSYSNYQGMHSTRSQSDSNRLELIKETSESPESKTSGVSRGSSYPNLSKIQQTKQKREAKTYNPKMWEDDGLLKNASPDKSSSLKRTTSEQVRSKIQDQTESLNIIVTSKPPASSSDRKISLDNQNRTGDLDSRKLHQQALMNFVERKKGRSVGSNSSHSSDGGSVSSPPSHKKWPSNSSETMVKQIHRSESFSDSTVSGGSDSRRHSTSSLQSQKDEKWTDSPNRKDPLVKSSAGPAPSFAQEERVIPAVRVEAPTGGLAPRPYKRPVADVALKSPDDETPPALPPRNYRKFDEEPPLAQTNNLRRFSTEGRLDQTSRRFSTEGRLDQTPVRKLSSEGTKEKFDSPREDAYVDRLRLASRRLSEHVMPNPARINLINSKPASYISHSVATQPMVPQEATGISQGQDSSPGPGSPTSVFQSNKTITEPDQTKDMFLTTLKIVEEKDEKERTRTTSPESSPDIPLPSPPRNVGEIIDEELPPPPDFLTEIEQAHDTKKHQLDQQELDNNRYPDGSYGSHKNNRSGARPFGSYQRSSSGPFNEPSEGSATISQERPKRLGERAWRSVQSLPPQAASPTSTPPPDSRTGKWLSYRQQTGHMSPVNTLPRNSPHRRASDNFQATAMKTSASFNTTVTLMSSRGSRENLTNGDSTSPSVRDRVSNFERSKYSERLNNSANTQSPSVPSDDNNVLTSVKTKDVRKSSENLSNSTDNTESAYNNRSAESNRNNTRVSENKSPSGVTRTTNILTPPLDYNSANNKRISLDNSVSNKGRQSESSTPSQSSPAVEAQTVNRPETLVIIHRREKSKEEEDFDNEAKLLAGQLDDSGLSQVISPPFELRSAMDYMNGLFEVTSPTGSVNRSNSSVTRLDVHVSSKPVDKSFTSNTSSPNTKISETSIPANSPYWISPAKAKLIERMRESNEFKLSDDDGNIEQKKEELMERINQKLEVLQRAKGDVQQDIDANNDLGKQITKTVNEKCKDQEKEKYKSFIEGLEKIVRLLLKLSGLLARAENALSCLSPDADQQQRSVLVDKRDHLLERHEEANRLKADIDKRRNVVAAILENYLNQEEIGDYMHFVDMKSRLTIEFQELEDKITLGQEQLQALKRSISDEK